jgi:hemoglobin/transferrin/lactoferrin receptor protein
MSYKASYENLFDISGQYSAYVNLFWSEGENKETNEAINEIEPNHALLGVQWLSGDETLSLSLHGNFVASKSDIDDLDDPEQSLAVTAGYATFDVIANYHINNQLTLSAAVNNLTDKRYYRWSDVNGMLADDPLLATMAAPGINGSVQLKYQW